MPSPLQRLVLSAVLATATQANAASFTLAFANADGSSENTWRTFFVANFHAEVAKHPEIAKVIYLDAGGEPDRQQDQLTKLISEPPDALVISAAHVSRLNATLRRLRALGVKVVAVDRGVDDPRAYDSMVVGESERIGYTQATWLANQVPKGGRILMMTGVEGTSAAEGRLRGARQALAKHPHLKALPVLYYDWQPGRAAELVRKVLDKGTTFDGIWADSGTGSLPALMVLAERKMPYVPSTGDQLNGYAKYLVKHELNGFIYPFTSAVSRIAVQQAVALLKDEKVKKEIHVEGKPMGMQRIRKLVRPERSDFWWIGDDLMPEKFLPKIDGDLKL